MRLRRWIPGVVVLLALVFGTSIAGAISSPGNGKLGYTEVVSDQGTLVVSIDESGQKRFASVDYQLIADASVYSLCESGQAIGVGFPNLTGTISATPDPQGHAIATVSLSPDISLPGGNTCIVSETVSYAGVTLTNLASGHTYRLEPASRTWP